MTIKKIESYDNNQYWVTDNRNEDYLNTEIITGSSQFYDLQMTVEDTVYRVLLSLDKNNIYKPVPQDCVLHITNEILSGNITTLDCENAVIDYITES